MYRTILFDLDGTFNHLELGDYQPSGLYLRENKWDLPDKKALRVFIGPPLQDSFERFYGFSKEECLKATIIMSTFLKKAFMKMRSIQVYLTC